MSIKNFSQMQNTLKNYGVKNWSKSVELGNNRVNNLAELTPKSTESVKSFGHMLEESIAKVNNLQQDADVAMQKLASGESKNLHETLLAVERADIAFKTMNQVRMKVIDAYRDIMKMQV